jgi:hypothetical protein
MNDEQIKASREKYWSECSTEEKLERTRAGIVLETECSTEEKLERTRKAVKQLKRDVALLNKFMRYLQTHSHLPDGSVVIPLFMKDEPQLTIKYFPETGDKVYF